LSKKFLKMKRTLSTMLIAGAVIIVALNACTKQDYAPITSTPPSPPEQGKLNLVADNWVRQHDGIFVSRFENILWNLAIPDVSRLNVYAKEDGRTILISDSPVMFKGHELWATIIRHDVVITYRCQESPMPFQTLHIEVAAN
jgi:hypothetical protein